MKSSFDWQALVFDCGGATRALEVMYVFRTELTDLTAQVRKAIHEHSPSALAYASTRLEGALRAVQAQIAAELAANLSAAAGRPGANPYPVWMKLCAELGRVEAAMYGVNARAA